MQRRVLPGLVAMAGYFGSKGTNLILRRNINQPIDGVRPYPAVSQSARSCRALHSAISRRSESTGNSSYNALWVSASKRLARGLQIKASYTGRSHWTIIHSVHRASSCRTAITCAAIAVCQISTRATVSSSAPYMNCPSEAIGLSKVGRLSVIVQAQSGNPVNIVTTNSTVTGVANTLRPDVTGPIAISAA